jgi:hypothetical protein
MEFSTADVGIEFMRPMRVKLLNASLLVLFLATGGQIIGWLGGMDWYWEPQRQGFRRIQLERYGLLIATCDPAPHETPPFINSGGDPVDRMTIGRRDGPSMASEIVRMARLQRVNWMFRSQFSLGFRDFGYESILSEPLMDIDWRDVNELTFEVKGDSRVPFRLHLVQVPYILILLPAMSYPLFVLIRGFRRRLRRRQGCCVECGYDLRGAMELCCSECGASIDDGGQGPVAKNLGSSVEENP